MKPHTTRARLEAIHEIEDFESTVLAYLPGNARSLYPHDHNPRSAVEVILMPCLWSNVTLTTAIELDSSLCCPDVLWPRAE